MTWFERLASMLWHMPGRIWAGMMAVTVPAAKFWSQVGAAQAWTLVFIGYGLVIWKGPWPARLAEKQLDLLGQGHLFAGFIVLVVIVCLTDTRVNFSAGREGVRGAVDSDDARQPAAVVTTRTEVHTPPAATPTTPPATDPESGDARPV